MSETIDKLSRQVANLGIWSGNVEPRAIEGGITNVNFLVEDKGQRYFVRLGKDIPVHGVMRFNEHAIARAAHAAGIAPEVLHTEPGILVTRFIEGRTLEDADVQDPAKLERIVGLIRRCHDEVAKRLNGPILMFWVFHVVRHYAGVLRAAESARVEALPLLMERADRLERAVGPINVVLGHNDLLAANLIDDGERLWLVDWEYAGFNSPMFDLGGLSSNCQFDEKKEEELLRLYMGRAPCGEDRRALTAMKAASLLRESMWSMVSEVHSAIDFDFEAYTDENLARFERAWDEFASVEQR